MFLDSALDILSSAFLNLGVSRQLHQRERRRRRAGLEAREEGARLVEQVLALELYIIDKSEDIYGLFVNEISRFVDFDKARVYIYSSVY